MSKPIVTLVHLASVTSIARNLRAILGNGDEAKAFIGVLVTKARELHDQGRIDMPVDDFVSLLHAAITQAKSLSEPEDISFLGELVEHPKEAVSRILDAAKKAPHALIARKLNALINPSEQKPTRRNHKAQPKPKAAAQAGPVPKATTGGAHVAKVHKLAHAQSAFWGTPCEA